VLLADTATRRGTPLTVSYRSSSSDLRQRLPAGLGMVGARLSETTPARRMAVGGAVLAFTMELQMERSMGLSAETLHSGKAGRLFNASRG